MTASGAAATGPRRSVLLRRVLAVMLLLEWLYATAATVVLVVFGAGMARFDGESAYAASLDWTTFGLLAVVLTLPIAAWRLSQSTATTPGGRLDLLARTAIVAIAGLHALAAAVLAGLAVLEDSMDHPILSAALALGAFVLAVALARSARPIL